MQGGIRMARYIYGSEAPNLVPEAPVRQPKRREQISEEERRKQKKNKQIEDNRNRATRFGIVYTLLVIAAMAVVLFTCSEYISRVSKKNTYHKQIEKLQNEVNELKQSNDLLELSIDTSIDYDYIYNIATKELGMRYAGDGQVVKYQSNESQYVIQYSNIPKE